MEGADQHHKHDALSLSLSPPLTPLFPPWFPHQLKPEAVVVSYLVFIKLHSSSGHAGASTAVPVLTSRGLLCPADEKVHFSQEYGNVDLTKELAGE